MRDDADLSSWNRTAAAAATTTTVPRTLTIDQSPVASVPREGKATLVGAVSVYKLGSSIVEEEEAGRRQEHTAKALGR